MYNKDKLEQLIHDAPSWVVILLTFIVTLVGGIVLYITWFYYKDLWNATNSNWFYWIQPALMVLSGVMCLIAAPLLAMRNSESWNYLRTAFNLVPIIFAVRLVIVALRFLGYVSGNVGGLMDGTLLDSISMSSKNIANLVIVIAIVLFALYRASRKSKNLPGDKKL